jgi:hypothetical protein
LGVPLGIRMTVVRLKEGGLWLHSPVPMTDADQRELETLGPVRWIIAPSKFHHLHAAAAKARFPSAALLGAPGLGAKRKDLAFDGALGGEPPAAWAADLRQHPVAGVPMSSEVAFHHVGSRTLIVADLLFNIPRPASFWPRLLLGINWTFGVPSQSRLFRAVVRDKAAYRASVEVIRGWDFDRIILSHGDVVPTGGKAAFTKALAWLG